MHCLCTHFYGTTWCSHHHQVLCIVCAHTSTGPLGAATTTRSYALSVHTLLQDHLVQPPPPGPMHCLCTHFYGTTWCSQPHQVLCIVCAHTSTGPLGACTLCGAGAHLSRAQTCPQTSGGTQGLQELTVHPISVAPNTCMCTYVCVCACVCMFVYVCVCACACMCVCACVYVHVCMCVWCH